MYGVQSTVQENIAEMFGRRAYILDFHGDRSRCSLWPVRVAFAFLLQNFSTELGMSFDFEGSGWKPNCQSATASESDGGVAPP